TQEQGFGKFGKPRFASDAARSCFFDQVQDRTLKPFPRGIRPDVDLKKRRKPIQYRATEIGIARHVATNKLGRGTAAAGPQWAQVARLDLVADSVIRKWSS